MTDYCRPIEEETATPKKNKACTKSWNNYLFIQLIYQIATIYTHDSPTHVDWKLTLTLHRHTRQKQKQKWKRNQKYQRQQQNQNNDSFESAHSERNHTTIKIINWFRF